MQYAPVDRLAKPRALDPDLHLQHPLVAPRAKHLLRRERRPDRPKATVGVSARRRIAARTESPETGESCASSHTPASQSASARCRSRAYAPKMQRKQWGAWLANPTAIHGTSAPVHAKGLARAAGMSLDERPVEPRVVRDDET